MADAFQRFAEGIARLITQSDMLRNERHQLEQTINQLQDSKAEIDDQLQNIEAESLAIARSYSNTAGLPTPISRSNGSSPDPLADYKPVADSDDEAGDAINVTPRRQACTSGKATVTGKRSQSALANDANVSSDNGHPTRSGRPPPATKSTARPTKTTKQAMVTLPTPAVIRPTSPPSAVPAKRLMEYETFQALEAEAKAIGVMKARKKRATGLYQTSDALASSDYDKCS